MYSIDFKLTTLNDDQGRRPLPYFFFLATDLNLTPSANPF
jgi:hypothetical protein